MCCDFCIKRQEKCLLFVSVLYVSIGGPSAVHKVAFQNKTAICPCFLNALKESTRLPLSNKILSAHVGG